MDLHDLGSHSRGMVGHRELLGADFQVFRHAPENPSSRGFPDLGLTPIRWIALPLLWLACLEIALIAWIPFRCSDLACVNAFAHGLTDWSQPAGLGLLAMGVALLCLLATLLEQWLKNSFLLILERALLAAGPFWAVLGAALLWLAIWCSPSGLPNFIYFQF